MLLLPCWVGEEQGLLLLLEGGCCGAAGDDAAAARAGLFFLIIRRTVDIICQRSRLGYKSVVLLLWSRVEISPMLVGEALEPT